MKKLFDGVISALVTPFNKGRPDFGSLKKLLRFQLDNKINGFVVCGSTGEAATLSLEEKREVLEFVLGEVSKAVPVIMGSGTFNTKETCELVGLFEKAQPDGFLIVTPYYNKPPQRGLIQHYSKVACATKLPVLIYNVPARTASKIDPETVAQIAKECSNVVGVKEATGDLAIIKKLKEVCDDSFLVSSGDDGTFLEAMSLGAEGVISVASNALPKKFVGAAEVIRRLYLEKNPKLSETVKSLNSELAPAFIEFYCESNPIPLKWALKEMGVIESAELRLPLIELDGRYHAQLRRFLQQTGAL